MESVVDSLHRATLRWHLFISLTVSLLAAGLIVGPSHAQNRRVWGEESRSESAITQQVNANTLEIISGNGSGTYLSIADDLSAVLDDGDNFRIIPIIGKGGAQNLRDVRFLKGVDVGITESIILNTFQRTKELGAIDEKITYIAKLFNEEMHVVVRAGSSITSIDQLEGKKVNFSELGSGTQLSARDVFARLHINVAEVNMGQADAIAQLKTGEIAATMLVAGKPSRLVERLRASDGFRLLPVPFAKELRTDYLPAALTSEDYPNLIERDSSVESIALSAVLIAYNWPRDSDRYRRIEKFVERFFPRLEKFRKSPRHPKWAEVNVAAKVPGWKRFPAAEEWLQRNKASAQTNSQQQEQFARFIGIKPDASNATGDRERLFRD
jgi:TRAP transporter TAXI family solute receptor